MINFLKRNWALIILVIVSVLYLKNYYPRSSYSTSSASYDRELTVAPMAGGSNMAVTSVKMGAVTNYPEQQTVPAESADRLIIQDTALSLQVKDVAKAIDEIGNKTKEFGGFLVYSHLSKPEAAASGNISVRIPEDKRKEAMTAFKSMAVKVVSESINGTDVTDQYTDLQAQLDVLQKTKVKFEEILNRATAVKDLLEVQQQLTYIQQQIDSVKGQQKYYEQSAKLSKITIYLSTDELALPYAPTNEWRPAVVFKEAVRSLVGSFRNLGNFLIWVIVYLPIVIPVFFVARYIIMKRKSKK